jgi:hypothetical protein
VIFKFTFEPLVSPTTVSPTTVSPTTVISGVSNIIPPGGIGNDLSGNVVPFGDVKVELLRPSKTRGPRVICFSASVLFLNSIYSIALQL